MSNAFEKELDLALKGLKKQLDTNTMQANNLALADKLTLYYAHGASQKASNKLITAQLKSQRIGEQFHEAQKTTEICKNVITAAAAANTNARNTTSKVSTAAVSIQIAANALTDLLADVTGVLTIATNKDVGSKISNLVNLAHELTRSVAEEGEKMTLQSLDTTIEAAQSRASVALTQAKTLSGDMDDLMKLLDQHFKALQTVIEEDTEALTTNVSKENRVDGSFKTAQEEDKAMAFSEAFINKHTNYDLKYLPAIAPERGEKFGISFDAFPEKSFVLQNGEIKCTKVVEEYRIFFVEKDDAATFDIHAAKASENFYQIDGPLGQDHYSMNFITAEYIAYLEGNQPEQTNFPGVAKDYNGKALQRGVPYVFFVHLIYDCSFQAQLEDTDGFLSMPSPDFTLKSQLPTADQPKLDFYTDVSGQLGSYKTSDAVRVSFTIDKAKLTFQDINLEDLVDFRVIMFKQDNVFANNLNQVLDQKLAALYQLDEECGMAEEQYLDAKLKYETAIANGSADVKALKGALAYAELVYDNKRSEYETKQEEMDTLYAAKLSNFILDQEILDKIPGSYGMIAEKIDESFLKELQLKIDSLTADRNAETQSINKEKEARGDVAKKRAELAKENQKTKTDVDKMKAEIKVLRNLIGAIESRTKGCFEEFIDLDDLESSVDKVDTLKTVLDDDDIKEIKQLIAAIVDLKKEIQQKEKGLGAKKEEEKALSKDLVQFDAQIALHEQNLKLLDYQIAVLLKEQKDLDTSLAVEKEKEAEIIRQIEAEMQNLQAKIRILKAGVRSPNSIMNLQNEEEQLQEKIKTADQKEEVAQDKANEKQGEIDKVRKEADKIKGDPKKAKDYKKLEEQINKLTIDLKKAQASVDNFNSEGKALKESLAITQTAIQKAEGDLKQYELELKGLSEKEEGFKSGDKAIFLARNVDGDFVDNYGEPMVETESYQALIYAVIKPKVTEAVPQFIPGRSKFSVADKFDPAQELS